MPDSDKGWGSGKLTDSSGNWENNEGRLSSNDVPEGLWRVEAYHVDKDLNRIPDSPFASTEFTTPCPFPTSPPDTEIYARVGDNEIFNGDSVSADSINFTYYIRDSFSGYARFDCKLDDESFKDCTTIRCENPQFCGLSSRGTVESGFSEKDMIIFLLAFILL